jgi:hypothetical protein
LLPAQALEKSVWGGERKKVEEEIHQLDIDDKLKEIERQKELSQKQKNKRDQFELFKL